MMSKERLEKHTHLTISVEEYRKYKELKERVRYLENTTKNLWTENRYKNELIKQNKRYREAIEKAIEYLKRVPVGSHGVNKAYEIMIKAMEEEE